jgi:hypothetical protein
MRLVEALLAVALAFGSSGVVLAKGGGNDLRFLGLHPHGPLARVTDGKLEEPEPGACRTWGKRGASWLTLDRFGRVVGRARVNATDRYDVTNCDELTLARERGKGGVGLFVSGGYQPLEIAAWSPSKRAERTLTKLTRMRDQPLARPHDIPTKQLPSAARRLFFRTPDGARRAAVGGKALTVYRFERGAWQREHQLRPSGEGDFAESFLIAGVLDMNADGAPELVVHWAGIDGYHDLTLSLGGGGSRWRTLCSGISGAYATLRSSADKTWATLTAVQPRWG